MVVAGSEAGFWRPFEGGPGLGRTWGHVPFQPLGVAGGGFELNPTAPFLSIRGVQHDLPHAADFQLAQRCLDRDEAALRRLMGRFGEPTVACLVRRGATRSEGEEQVGELWAECVERASGLPGRLLHYDGNCALQTWLNTVAFHRWYNARRTQQRRDRILGTVAPGSEEDPGEVDAAAETPESDAPLIAMMREALEEAFAQCPAEDFVILQLMHCDRLRLHELALMFECHEGSMSKRVRRAEKKIAAAVLGNISARDPGVVLTWDDFLELCRTATPECLRQQ